MAVHKKSTSLPNISVTVSNPAEEVKDEWFPSTRIRRIVPRCESSFLDHESESESPNIEPSHSRTKPIPIPISTRSINDELDILSREQLKEMYDERTWQMYFRYVSSDSIQIGVLMLLELI